MLDGQQQLLQLREAMETRKRELSEGGNAEEQTENVVTINKHQVTAFTVLKLQFPCDHDAACVTSVLCCAANLCLHHCCTRAAVLHTHQTFTNKLNALRIKKTMMADQRQLSQLRAELDEVKAATNAQSVADVVTAIARQAEVAQDLADMRSQVEQEHERLQEEEQALQTQLADLRCLLLGERLSVWRAYIVQAVTEVCCELFAPQVLRHWPHCEQPQAVGRVRK